MSALISALKNEHTKQILRATRIRPPAVGHGTTPHYRMPELQAAGGYLVLGKYRGPEIPRREREDLTYTTYATDPATFFAPVTSVTGKMELKGFWEYREAAELSARPVPARRRYQGGSPRGAGEGMPRGCRRSLAACTAAECRAAPVLREVHREPGMRVCFFVEEPAGRDLPGAGDLMARREITEAGQQRLDRYKQRRDEYLRELAHLAPPLSGEQKARLAVLLAPAVEEYRRRKTP